MRKKRPRSKRIAGGYALDQCALYKVGSKSRLGMILDKDIKILMSLCTNEGNYRVFKRPEEICEFTKKKTKERWVQEPVGELKHVLSRVAYLIGGIKLPDYCHGAAQGRSYLSNAAAHKGAKSVATFDIKSFFPSTPVSRVYGFFREGLGCAPDVAEILSNLCCYDGVLPTGAPTSPVVSFYANRALFDELHGLAQEYKLNFSVYLDDLTFSGDHVPRGFVDLVERIVLRHGHKLSTHKTRRFSEGVPRHITGVVVVDGAVRVPHGRFHKARGLMRAARVAATDLEKYIIVRRLAGLLGEAAFLDPRYKRWAQRTFDQMAALRGALNKAGVAIPDRKKRHSRVGKGKKRVARLAGETRKTSGSVVEEGIAPWL